MAMYETNEVHERIPEAVRNALWIALDNMTNPNFNQRFALNAVQTGDTVCQHIIHTQKDSQYKKEYTLKLECPVDAMTVYIIGFDKHWLMLLQP